MVANGHELPPHGLRRFKYHNTPNPCRPSVHPLRAGKCSPKYGRSCRPSPPGTLSQVIFCDPRVACPPPASVASLEIHFPSQPSRYFLPSNAHRRAGLSPGVILLFWAYAALPTSVTVMRIISLSSLHISFGPGRMSNTVASSGFPPVPESSRKLRRQLHVPDERGAAGADES